MEQLETQVSEEMPDIEQRRTGGGSVVVEDYVGSLKDKPRLPSVNVSTEMSLHDLPPMSELKGEALKDPRYQTKLK